MRQIALKTYGFWTAWKGRVGNYPMWGYATGDTIWLCWLVLWLCKWFDRCLQVLGHEMTHQLGEPHHPDSHGCAMVAAGAPKTWLHIKVTKDDARAYAKTGEWTAP